MWFLWVWVFVWLSLIAYSTTRKCGLASQSINTHGDFLEVKKNKADDVDE